MAGKGQCRLVCGVIITKYQVAFGILVVIGIRKFLQTVAGVNILGEKKPGAIHKGNNSLYYSDFGRSGVCIKFGGDNQIRAGIAVYNLGK